MFDQEKAKVLHTGEDYVLVSFKGEEYELPLVVGEMLTYQPREIVEKHTPDFCEERGYHDWDGSVCSESEQADEMTLTAECKTCGATYWATGDWEYEVE